MRASRSLSSRTATAQHVALPIRFDIGAWAVYGTAVKLPELTDLIWLFDDEPTAEYPDLHWPAGLQTFRLRRGDIEVVLSLDPFPGDVYLSMYAGGREISSLGRLRTIETLTVVKRDGYEGLELRFAGGKRGPLIMQTRPDIKVSWNVAPLGT
jgi:hypothetical protein